MRHILVLMAIASFSCSRGEKTDTDPIKEKQFDVVNHVNIGFVDDTINAGEKLELKINYDSTYLSLFNEKPAWVLPDSSEIPLGLGEGDISSAAYYFDFDSIFSNPVTAQKGFHIDTITAKLRFKVTKAKDTILTFKRVYTLTNLESSRRTEGKLVNGKKEGEWKYWYDDGRKIIKEISQWSNGRRHGITKEFWESGGVQKVTNYVDGERVGKEEHYSSSGKLYDPYAN